MIRKIKKGEEFKYKAKNSIMIEYCDTDETEFFVNSENYSHNDNGPAWSNGFGYISCWFWNGRRIK